MMVPELSFVDGLSYVLDDGARVRTEGCESKMSASAVTDDQIDGGSGQYYTQKGKLNSWE